MSTVTAMTMTIMKPIGSWCRILRHACVFLVVCCGVPMCHLCAHPCHSANTKPPAYCFTRICRPQDPDVSCASGTAKMKPCDQHQAAVGQLRAPPACVSFPAAWMEPVCIVLMLRAPPHTHILHNNITTGWLTANDDDDDNDNDDETWGVVVLVPVLPFAVPFVAVYYVCVHAACVWKHHQHATTQLAGRQQ